MKNPFKIAYQWIKNKIKPDKVTLPVPSRKEIVAELEIQLELRQLLSGFQTMYPHLYNYNQVKEFWVCFFTACSYVESNYDRFCKYMEPAPLYYLSLGLLQLSHVDQTHYTFCDIQGDNIFKVNNNLACGIGILNVLVKKNKKPVFNDGHYWSVLQPKRGARHEKFRMKLLQLCKQEGVEWNGKF